MKKILIFSLPLLVTLFFTNFTYAEAFTVESLISRPSHQWVADVDTKYLAYSAFDTGYHEGYLYNFKTGEDIQITFYNDSTVGVGPKIHGNYIVWGAGGDIYLYDIKKGLTTNITEDSFPQHSPVIYGNNVAWLDNSVPVHANDIFVYNIKTGKTKQITNDKADSSAMDIYKNILVWTDNRLGNHNTDIYMYDLVKGEEIQLVSSEANQRAPKIYKDKIVWEDLRNRGNGGDPDIYMYDLKTGQETVVSTSTDYEGGVVISEDYIAYTNFSQKGIFVYDFETERNFRITDYTGKTQSQPTISRDRLVWADYRDGAPDLYQVKLR